MDSQIYLERMQALLALAARAPNDDERAGYTSLAGTYAGLASEAATFERTFGESLTESVAV